ncbi:MAG: hypothetical protein FK734_05545 [Asgard group archaeon]|nr:hypothetical protein [Asgard group archaeon]
MTIVGAFILPHGSMILDPKKKGLPKEAIDLHHAMKKMASEINSLKPDLIFMTTPHSIALSNDFGLYLNVGGSGSAEWNNEYSEFQVKVEFDLEIANELLEFLVEKETAINGIATFTASIDAPLKWGEAVPLWFLRNLNSKPKYILMSQPMRRYDNAKDLIPETLTLGNDLRIFFEGLKKRVVILISADLGHTHQESGPYGYTDIAQSFDELIEKWALTLDSKILLKEAVPLLDKALICGFIGFVMLQGILDKMKVQPEIFARLTPSYYGMMVAKYSIIKK